MLFEDGSSVAEIDRRAHEQSAILIVGHGSREARANAELEQLVAAYRARVCARGAVATVAHAYVELAQPLLDDALASLAASHRRGSTIDERR